MCKDTFHSQEEMVSDVAQLALLTRPHPNWPVWLAQFGGHHRLEDYARRGAEPKDEVQVYTWPDASLRELTDLVKEVQPAARRSTARLDFALVYPDKRGRNVMRVVRGLR